MFCQYLLVFAPSAFADTSNFYFSDFTGDYYLYRDDEGMGRLKVVESVTAVFPNFNQNKGICRQIPFTNQNGANITLPNLTSQNIKVTRNGVSEPIYSIEKGKDYYSVCTGTEEYVLGEQIYTFEYEFTKVVTEFDQDGHKIQELYWDTNGNGSLQRFDSVTARVHFEDPEVFAGDSWCYVGKYGKSGKDRCEITAISDGVQFVTKNLMSEENLTFDVELKAGSFVVPEVEKNYVYVWILVGFGVVCVMCIGFALRKYLKTREKKTYYKGIFVKPEYQPNANYGLTEMAEIYLGKKKDMKVAMLLEMIVQEIADVMYRGLDPDLVITLADSHEHPGWKSQEDQVVGWIKAAAIIAGKDPIKEGYLDKSGETLPLPRRPEGFLVHLGDHDFVLTAPVSRWLNAEIEKMAVKEYGIAESELKSKKYNTLRNYIYSQASDMHLYQTWVDKGDKALWDAVLDVVVPD